MNKSQLIEELSKRSELLCFFARYFDYNIFLKIYYIFITNFSIFFCFYILPPCSRKIFKANNRQRFAILRAQRKAKINCLSRRRVLIFVLQQAAEQNKNSQRVCMKIFRLHRKNVRKKISGTFLRFLRGEYQI